MAQKIARAQVRREDGYLYFVDKSGDVSRVRSGGGRAQKVARTKIRKERGYLYFLDKQGDVSRAKMARRGR